jgi:hypothetical protein
VAVRAHAGVHRERSATQRSVPARGRGPAARVLALQRTAGNRATAALVQRSCSCAGSHTPCEDCAADQGAASRLGRSLQRACSGGHACECGCTKDAAADAGAAPVAPAPAAPAIKKTVNVYPISLGSSTRDPYVDIKRADAIWSQCGVKVNGLIGQCSTSRVLDTTDPKDVLNEFSDPASPTVEETAMLALRPGPASALHAYYVPRMSAGSRGEAFTPTVNKTSAVVISDSAASDSLAHEIGHVLLDSGSHNPTDPDDLMASGTIRNVGVDKLDATQCAKAVA